ncbi:ThiF family adenylyltransferase [Oerskovia sp. M15]
MTCAIDHAEVLRQVSVKSSRTGQVSARAAVENLPGHRPPWQAAGAGSDDPLRRTCSPRRSPWKTTPASRSACARAPWCSGGDPESSSTGPTTGGASSSAGSARTRRRGSSTTTARQSPCCRPLPSVTVSLWSDSPRSCVICARRCSSSAPRTAHVVSSPRRSRRADAPTLSLLRPDGSGHATLVRRAEASVGIEGLGRLGVSMAVALATAGVGTLLLDDVAPVQSTDVGLGGFRPRDVGLPRREAAVRLLADLAPDVRGRAVDAATWVSPRTATGRGGHRRAPRAAP